MSVRACPVPAGSRIAQALPGADFADAYQFSDPAPEASVLQCYLSLVARTPAWMNALMGLRNRAVALVGLKNVGALGRLQPGKPASAYRVGDRVGIFSLLHLGDDEIILGDDDKHLRVRLSLVRRRSGGQALLVMSTVVHIHNRLGHAYMAVVGPVHQRIVPRLLAQVAQIEQA